MKKEEDEFVLFSFDNVVVSIVYCLRNVVDRLRTACSLYELGRRWFCSAKVVSCRGSSMFKIFESCPNAERNQGEG